MGEAFEVLLAIVSSSLGGTAAAITRYLSGGADPLTLAILRWGIGFVCVLPIALILRVRWPRGSDVLAVGALGLCFYGLFFILYNLAISYTTAAREPRALDLAAAEHAGRRPPWRRTADRAQIGGSRHRRPRRVRRARIRAVRRAAGSLARRTDHDRRRLVHGLLQCLVPPLHRALERARLSRTSAWAREPRRSSASGF